MGTLEIQRSQLLQEIEELSSRLRQIDREAEALRRIMAPDDGDGRYGPRGGQWLEAAFHLLGTERRPIHYKELLRRLRDEGYEIGGTAAGANLVTRLNRDWRFKRVGRGTYSLSAGTEAPCETVSDLSPRAAQQAEAYVETVAECERRRARLRHVSESVEVEIEVVSTAIRQLRARAQRGETKASGQDPFVAVPTLEKRLTRLLEQRVSFTRIFDPPVTTVFDPPGAG